MKFADTPPCRCGSCRHFQPAEKPGPDADLTAGPPGLCRALPPGPVILPAPGGFRLAAAWPPVTAAMSCGLFMPKPEFNDNPNE